MEATTPPSDADVALFDEGLGHPTVVPPPPRRPVGTLCWRIQQESATIELSRLLWKVSDMSESGRGGEHVVELIRRLLFLRGCDKVNTPPMIAALAHVADFLHETTQAAETSLDQSVVSSSSTVDTIVQNLLKANIFFYVEFPPGIARSPPTTLLPPKATGASVSPARFPALWISVVDFLKAVTVVGPSSLLELILARFIEKAYCRIADRRPTLPVVSSIACVIDVTGVPQHQDFHGGQMAATLRLLARPLWVFSPVFVRALVVYGAASKAHEVLWRPVLQAVNPWLDPASDAPVRVILCETEDQLRRSIGSNWLSRAPMFGGFEDETVPRYACDYGATLKDHLFPGAFMLDDFWQNAPDLRRRMREFQKRRRRMHKPPVDPNVCQKGVRRQTGGSLRMRATVTQKEEAGRCVASINAVPCAGAMQTELDERLDHVTQTLKLTTVSEDIDVKTYIREAAARDILGLSTCNVAYRVPTEEKRPSVVPRVHLPLQCIHRDPARICIWKHTGYAELYKPISAAAAPQETSRHTAVTPLLKDNEENDDDANVLDMDAYGP